MITIHCRQITVQL